MHVYSVVILWIVPENELSRELGVKLNPVTSGPVVDESLETNVPGSICLWKCASCS